MPFCGGTFISVYRVWDAGQWIVVKDIISGNLCQGHLLKRLQGMDLKMNVEGILAARKTKTKMMLHPDKPWLMARVQYGVPKSGELLWRLLHDKVRAGQELEWISGHCQRCPVDGQNLSTSHIWVACMVAQMMWKESSIVWEVTSTITHFSTKSLSELLAYMSVDPSIPRIEIRR
nr:hypothetical protein CFP56_02535 [Quercus suber]